MVKIFSPPWNNLPHKKRTSEKIEDGLSLLGGLMCLALYIFYCNPQLILKWL